MADPAPGTGPVAAETPRAGTLTDAARMSFGTLTAFPVTPPSRVDGPVAGRAMLLAPLAALVPGVSALVVAWLCAEAGLSSLVAASLVVGVLALTTRGLHLDGLADTADGLAASYDRDRALDVMKRGDVGPAGVATVVIVLLVQVAALSQVLPASPVTALVAVLASRVAVPLTCLRGVPPARPDGLGAAVSGSVSRTAFAVCAAVVALCCTALLSLTTEATWSGPLVVATALVAAAAVLWRAITRLGGVTGDVIGACVEASLAAALITQAVAV
jgi:adenosylcobinamide-GDP ribazoletransferase